MSESVNICLECGLCCDGTLIGFVQLGSEEMPALRRLMEIEEVDGKGFFFHPCSKLEGTACTIYSQRPAACGKFKCGLLKSFENEELCLDLALDAIKQVSQKKAAIEKQLETLQIELQSQSFYFKMVELKTMLRNNKAGSTLSQNYPELIAELEDLDKLITKRFGLSF